ncbi:MAG TPA: hypothetical protein IAB67_03935 [Candidatus Ventrousia excrementavium]|uniref:Helix-turn-helix type 11 domain-containing protein n=1 Tax=Candidatus Ventrousia excrementavium TaxID=2840961 RepID=A0A9D1IU74_9CLOT|nr:hypothetical protein [Candidatus Ventrousia excrementavium]
MKIEALLSRGRAGAVPMVQLVAWTGLDSRSIRQLIERERRQGAPILSDNRSGYFLAGSPEEVERFSRSMEHRAREILRTAAAVRAAAGCAGRHPAPPCSTFGTPSEGPGGLNRS